MLTRCPSCDTTFRITPEQLKAKQGRVRCGQCQTVFNAIETLAEATALGVEPSSDIEEPEERAVPPAPTFELEAQTPEVEVASIPPEPAPEPPPRPVETPPAIAVEPAAPSQAIETFPGLPPMAPMPPMAPLAQVGSARQEELFDYEPSSFDTLLAEEAPGRRWPWVLGVMVGLLGLGMQTGHHFRTEVTLLAPETKPAIQEICAALGCDLPLPRKADLIGIETSDLHPGATPSAGLLLTASIKNRAPFAQQYPHLELALTDTADKAVVRRVLSPADYLPKSRAAKFAEEGFAANGNLAINLTLDVKDAAPVGYRLYVFYP